jgi:serine/threonine protein kinase
MPLGPGTQLGPYEILALIGAGGMGEVYRARDTRLRRDVAIKVLPDAFLHDPERLARLKREAEALAALNHPNIAGIYGLEDSGDTSSIVLELVEGDTLADRIAQGPIPVTDAIEIARQIAEALEAAHDKGVVHRDLKPGNIKITPDGTVKVLDFGLAKIVESDVSASALTQSPTLTLAATGRGVILGTAAYMSPEQARGRPADRRADIFSYGCVLYEMLTGRQAFDGETVSDTLASVLKSDVDFARLPAETPTRIRRLLERCLKKDPRLRLPHIGVARLEIEEERLEPSPPRALVEQSTRGRTLSWPWMVAAVFFVISAALGAIILLHREPTQPGSVRFDIEAPSEGVFGNQTGQRGPAPPAPHLAVSPDGTRVAYVVTVKGRTALWVRRLDALAGQELPGTDDASFPFWSPDSRALGFFAGGHLKKIDVTGGPSVTICPAPLGEGGTWNQTGDIVFTPDQTSGLYRVAAAGGVPSAVTTLDAATGEVSHRWPQFLPDGRHFLYLTTAKDPKNGGLFAASLDPGPHTRVLNNPVRALYSLRHVLFVQEGALMAQPFDPSSLRLSGEPLLLAEDVAFNENNRRTGFGVSDSGVLAYRTGNAFRAAGQLAWVDRNGKTLQSISGPGNDDTSLRLSPDERTIIVSRLPVGGQSRDLWTLDLTRDGLPAKLTFGVDDEASPVWSPDGAEIVFRSGLQGVPGKMYRKKVKDNAAPVLLSDDGGTPWDWSRDGEFIVYQRFNPKGRNDIWILPLRGDAKPRAFLDQEYAESFPRFSPDGRWIAYASQETGRDEVYVRSFPAGDHQQRVSVDGGIDPQWRRDGRELFYLSPQGQIMAVDFKGGTSAEVALPKQLFPTRIRGTGGTAGQYAVSADGQRFLITQSLEEVRQIPITVLTNWTASLKR